MTVLVTAATGTVGRHVVPELVDRDATVRAGTRDPDSFAVARSDDPAVEPVALDFERPETWGAALDGVDRLFLVRPPTVDTDRLREFVDAAARVGVERVVYLSALGADRNPLIPHFWIERHLRGAGVDPVLLRASFFAQNLHEVHGRDLRERDELFLPAGDGATSFVDARDVAAAAAVVLTEPDPRETYDLTGSEALTYREAARVFGDVLGRPVEYASPSVPRFVWRSVRRGDPVGFVLLMVGIYTVARLGLAERVTDDLEGLLGREPRSLRDYVEDYAGEFEPGTRAASTATGPPE